MQAQGSAAGGMRFGQGGSATIGEYDEAMARLAPVARTKPRTTASSRTAGESWVVILAGGEGKRIRSYTTLADGVAVPKQFCRFRDERSLLAATLDRALSTTSAERVIALVMDAHRSWWEGELARLPAANVLSQPDNHGTAVAILQGLVEIHCRDRNPRIVVMPSDCDVDDEAVLLGAIEAAQRTARSYPRDVVLLGMTPSHVDSEYGLILPAAGRPGTARRVRSFIEKPPIDVARRLTREGAMWNSFIFACEGWALYDLYEDTLPSVAEAYLRGLAHGAGRFDPRPETVGALPAHDFGHDVLERSTDRLRLVEVPECGWTDLGTPARLASWLARHREAVFWREHRLPRLTWDGGMGGSVQPAT